MKKINHYLISRSMQDGSFIKKPISAYEFSYRGVDFLIYKTGYWNVCEKFTSLKAESRNEIAKTMKQAIKQTCDLMDAHLEHLDAIKEGIKAKKDNFINMEFSPEGAC